MRVIQGKVLAVETGRGVGGVIVTAFAEGELNAIKRVGSVTTTVNGDFRIEYDSGKAGWNIILEVSVESPLPLTLYRDPSPRANAGDNESWVIRLDAEQLTKAQVIVPKASAAAELPALGSVLARTVADAGYAAEIKLVIKQHLDPRRAQATATATRFHDELLRSDRSGAAPATTGPVLPLVRGALARGLTSRAVARPRKGFAVLTAEERQQLAAATGANGAVPASIIEPLLFGDLTTGPRTAVDLLAAACRNPRTIDEACPPATTPAPPPPPTATTTSRELADAVWAELHHTEPTGQARPSAADVWRTIDGLRVTTGPADAPAIHDFSTLQVPFEDVWRDLIDDEVVDAAANLHAEVERLGGQPSPSTGVTPLLHLRRESRFLATQAPPLLRTPRVMVRGDLPHPSLLDEPGVPDPLGNEGTRWVSVLLAELERKINEPYRFTVYAADDHGTAINFGILTTYRQVWYPLNYQAGRLVETVTLAPREERTYSRKVTTTAKRRVETKEKWRSITRAEDQVTQRAVRDIVETAEHRTGLQASGSYGPVSGSLTIDDARTSSDTRQNFREAVRKASSEYETDRAVDVSFETSQDVVTESTGKLSNPNDELAVTYLFYQLQRRFRVSEHLHRVTPVVLVAQPVPRPNQINITWILQHDWILRRVLLDRSFVGALDTVNTSLVGEEATVGQLRATLDKQRDAVESLRVSLANTNAQSRLLFDAIQRVQRANAGLDDSGEPVDQSLLDLVKHLFGAGLSEEQKRVRLQTAGDTLNRSEAYERALTEQLQRELGQLTAATEHWAAASRALLDKTVDVQRLRLHIKQNILYYMQAIWDHEPPDQRYFRLHQLPVPVVDGSLRYYVEGEAQPPLPPHWTQPVVVRADLTATLTEETVALAQLADLDRPLGYRGNYAIFPVREANVITQYLTLPYVDRHAGAHDPDHLANLTRAELEAYACCLRHQAPEAFAAYRAGLEAAHLRLMEDPRPLEEEIVVPTDALFIEALPADRPLLEDYKLRHRAADAAKAEAEAARVRLDNLRRGARILANDLADPDIDKKTLIVGNPAGVVVSGDNG